MKKICLVFTAIMSSVLYVHAFESAPRMFLVDSTYSGHEEITRQALNNISKKIRETGNNNDVFSISTLNFDLQAEPRGLFGYKSKNMIINGNFASDFPKQTKVMSLADFWNDKHFSDFENPRNQVIHFLRNYKNTVTLESAMKTCLQARSNIKYITQEAIRLWESGEKTRALFLIGHATHTIQDSFSRAHTDRDDAAHNYNLKNICFYGNVMYKKIDIWSRDPKTKICYHFSPDSKDAIWNIKSKQSQQTSRNWGDESSTQCDKFESYPETDLQKKSCMNHEARLARVATEKYLFLVFNQLSAEVIIKKTTSDFLATMDTNLFDGPVGDELLDQKMPMGIIRCEGLSDQEIVGSEPIENNG